MNGEEITILTDSGSCQGIVPRKLINSNQLDDGVVWVKQLFLNDLPCLPAADLTPEIECLGSVMTKAIVADKETNFPTTF